MLSSAKLSLLLACSLVVAMANAGSLVGGAKNLDGEELKEAEAHLQNSLSKLAAGEGPVYKISKVHSATRQVVSGTLTKLEVDLIDNNNAVKHCKVSIWSQPWLKNGVQVTFDCEGEEKVVKKHSA